MGLSSTSREDQARLIGLLCDSDKETFPSKNYEWASDPTSYESSADSHLVYLALWCLRKLFPKIGQEDRPMQMPTISAHLLRSRNLSPFLVRENGVRSVILPSGFFKMLHSFYRAYFVGVSKGRTPMVLEKTKSKQSGLSTDHIGGLSLWRALSHDFESCRPWINQQVQHMVFNEVLPDHLQLLSDAELSRIANDILGLLGYKEVLSAEPPKIDNLTLQVTSATYLTIVFAVFHEVSHIVLDAISNDDKVLRGNYGAGPMESLIDAMAYQAYYDYVEQILVDKSYVLHFPDDVTAHIFGPASLFMVTGCAYNVVQYFIAFSEEKARDKLAYQTISRCHDEVARRKNALIDVIANDGEKKALPLEKKRQLLLALQEFYVMEYAINKFFKPPGKTSIGTLGHE